MWPAIPDAWCTLGIDVVAWVVTGVLHREAMLHVRLQQYQSILSAAVVDASCACCCSGVFRSTVSTDWGHQGKPPA